MGIVKPDEKVRMDYMLMREMETYSYLKGFNYLPSYARNDVEFWRDYDHDTVERELGYAERLTFNCARVFLSYTVYRHDREKFLRDVLDYVRTAEKHGISVMPVVWDSCFSEREPRIDADINEWIPNPGPMYLGREHWDGEEAYCRDLIETLREEKGFLLWDIHNEPLMTEYFLSAPSEEKERRRESIWEFVRHFCRFFRREDGAHPVTVGVAFASEMETVAEECDVLSFHTYADTWDGLRDAYETALDTAKKYGKAVFCSETGCPARANPYDIAIETANRAGVGYILWELMIGRCFWYDRHGVVYPDGTVRDPSIVAALLGFFRKREDRVDYNINTEGAAESACDRAEKWLHDPEGEYGKGMELLCILANLVESGGLAPECELPSAKYIALMKNPDPAELRRMMKIWVDLLRVDAERKRGKNYSVLTN